MTSLSLPTENNPALTWGKLEMIRFEDRGGGPRGEFRFYIYNESYVVSKWAAPTWDLRFGILGYRTVEEKVFQAHVTACKNIALLLDYYSKAKHLPPKNYLGEIKVNGE